MRMVKVQTDRGVETYGVDDPELELHLGDRVVVAVRPEKIQILEDAPAKTEAIANRFRGRIRSATYVGEARIYDITLSPDLSLRVKVQSGPDKRDYDVGADVTIGWQTRHGLALNTALPSRTVGSLREKGGLQ